MAALRVNFDHSLGFVLNDISRLARLEFERRVRRFKLTRDGFFFFMRPGTPAARRATSRRASSRKKSR